jgi:signal transduction histidine kinase
VNAATKDALTALGIFTVFFLAGVLLDAPLISGQNALAWILAAGIPALIITILIRVYTKIRVRRSGSDAQSLKTALTGSVIFGFVFGVMLAASIDAFGLNSRLSPALIVLTFVLTVAIGGTALIVFVNSWVAERERRARLLEEAIAVNAMREDMADINERLRVALNSDIDDALAPARVSIEDRLIEQERAVTNDDWEAIAGELRSAANNTVKPLSRRLWASTAAQSRPIRFRWVLRNVVTKQPFQPLLLSIVALTGLVDEIATYGLVQGTLSIAGAIVVIFVLLGGANIVMKRKPQHHAAIFITTIVIAMSLGLVNFPVREAAGTRYTWLEFLVGFVLGTIAILVTSSIGSIRTHRDDVARTFQADIDREAVQLMTTSRQAAQLARESARILHGTVQTRLIACAVAIEQAAESNDAEAYQVALHEAQQILRAPVPSDDRTETMIAEEVQRKVGLWQGLCSIGVDLDPQIAVMSGRRARDVGRVVEEGLSNAIRHGGAKEISVRVTEGQVGSASGGDVVVVIEDNGSGPGSGKLGLGSSLLDSVSQTWELKATGSGARLSVVMA